MKLRNTKKQNWPKEIKMIRENRFRKRQVGLIHLRLPYLSVNQKKIKTNATLLFCLFWIYNILKIMEKRKLKVNKRDLHGKNSECETGIDFECTICKKHDENNL
jgi:hypothetical protein